MMLTDFDIHLLTEGTHRHAHEKLGAHGAGAGTSFALWAPDAAAVSVIGDFNGWTPYAHPMTSRLGTWETFVEGARPGQMYKFKIIARDGSQHDISDPYAFAVEPPPGTASMICDLDAWPWGDTRWSRPAPGDPMTILEEEQCEPAQPLANHVQQMGFTHVELLQATSGFAPAASYSDPYCLMSLIDTLHSNSVGVILEMGAEPCVSSAIFWLTRYRADGLRVLAEWLPALSAVYAEVPDALILPRDPVEYFDFGGERFTLPLSSVNIASDHRSLFQRMPGDDWRKFGGLRVLYGYMFLHPGPKRMFKVHDFGHGGLRRWVRDLNTLYRGQPELHDGAGFEWIERGDHRFSFRRRSLDGRDIVAVFNLAPQPWPNYRIGVGTRGNWQESVNSDAVLYGGSGHGNLGVVATSPIPMHGHPQSLNVTLPPLAVIAFQPRQTRGDG